MSAKKVQESQDNQFLTFYVAGDMYAISVLHIKEILEYSIVTKVPLMNEAISGITNIRGNVIPVVDLGIRLNVSKEQKINKRTSIIVVKQKDSDKDFDMGLIVDEVNEVYEIFTKEQENAPTFGSKIKKEFIEHIGKVKGEFIPILNSYTILDVEELSQILHFKDIK